MSKEYRARAEECWRLAAAASSPEHRASLLEMAQAWMRLHDQAARNAKSDLTYETPPRREAVVQQQQQQQPPPAAKDESEGSGKP
jgi:hypothetical protein